jgi:predicted transcriptional regulator of viral defense system
MMTATLQHAVQTFLASGGILRTTEALALGVHPRTLYALRDDGTLEQLSRGVFRLVGGRPLSQPDLVSVALRCPDAVICLVSALAFHEATEEIPHVVHIALPRTRKAPRMSYPPIQAYRFSDEAYSLGVKTVAVDDIPLKVYDLPKTVVDCFRFRNTIGIDIAVSALQTAVRDKGVRPSDILQYARPLRMTKVLLPYLQSVP